MTSDRERVDGSGSQPLGPRLFDSAIFSLLARVFLGVIWLLFFAQVATELRPDLLHPADFGTDTSNYAAAGERLLDGALYELAPGDRPVSVDNPPEWAVPILSPPPVATVWAVLRVLPDPLLFHLPWLAGLAGMLGLALYFTARAPLLPLVAAMYLFAGGVAITAWSGNVNAVIAPAMAALWLLSAREGSRSAQVAAGVIVALAAVMKLGPAVLGLWLLTQRRWTAVIASVVTGAVVLLVTLWLGGPSVFVEYVDIVRQATAVPSPLSIPGFVTSLGVPAEYGTASLFAAIGIAAIALVALQRYPRLTFAIAVLAAVLATTVVRSETLAVGIAALTPWAASARPLRVYRWLPPMRSVVLTGVIGATLIAGWVAASTGGLVRSSMVLVNESATPVVVRFSVPGQWGTFAFPLAAGAAGTAWFDQMGTVTQQVRVFSPACDLLHQFHSPRDGSVVLITGDSVTIGPPPDAVELPFLPYTHDCAGRGA